MFGTGVGQVMHPSQDSFAALPWIACLFTIFLVASLPWSLTWMAEATVLNSHMIIVRLACFHV